ncbi:uncharacterized protein LOC142579799 isoform X1 [Dermacentor variabilis]|uniref:uncharacterized protein LOC142579799 isoform X1 n=1 Tax=Dermacentor variabilis TaxID=34621 RepID=UPI003F5C3D64
MPCCVKIFSMWGFGEFKVFLFSVDNSRKEECKPIERSRKGELLPVFLLCCVVTVAVSWFIKFLLRKCGFGPNGVIPGSRAALLRIWLIEFHQGMFDIFAAVENFAIQGFTIQQTALIIMTLYSFIVSIPF